MEQHKIGNGLDAVDSMLDKVGFTHWQKNYYERYKDMDMFDFIRGVNEIIIPKLKKEDALQRYIQQSYTDRQSWWSVTKADIRLDSEIGEYLRLLTYNIYDHEVGGMAQNDEEHSLEQIDQHFTRQKSIAIHLKAFQDILSEFGGAQADFAEELQEWKHEYKRIYHWVGGRNGMANWLEKYIIPKMLEEQGHSEEEIQELIDPPRKIARDDVLNSKDYKETWQGLI